MGEIKLSIFDAMDELMTFAGDRSGFQSPQIYHSFQTSEDLRRRFPDESFDWLWLDGFLHDFGKVLSLPKFGGLPEWAVVGDTFPVGCQHSEKIVYHEFFHNNPDASNDLYNTPFGIYSPNCGLKNLKMSWGQDEYLYLVLLYNKCTIPQIGLNIIRFRSFHSWHSHGEYSHLISEEDKETKDWVKRFTFSDLYSKSSETISVESIEKTLKPLYQKLIRKYFPNEILAW